MTAEQLPTPLSVYTEKQRSRFLGLPLTLTQYVIDGETLSAQTGLFSVTTKAVCLSHIRNMVVVQSAWQKLFGLSTVRVATADPAVPEFVVRNIRGGAVFAARLQQARENTSSLRQNVTE